MGGVSKIPTAAPAAQSHNSKSPPSKASSEPTGNIAAHGADFEQTAARRPERLMSASVSLVTPEQSAELQRALAHAVQSDDRETINSLTQQGVSLNAAIEGGPASPMFHLGHSSGGLGLVQALTQLGGDIKVDRGAGSALHAAVTHKNLKMVLALLHCGADPMQSSRAGANALTLALAQGNDTPIVRAINASLDAADSLNSVEKEST